VTEPVWLAPTDVLGLHEMQIAEIGGAAGIRDIGGIEANVARPQHHFHLGCISDVHQLAAIYAAAFATTQHFIDGNKRTAFACALLFLDLNGWILDADPLEAAEKTLDLSNKRLTAEKYGEWLKVNSMRPRDNRQGDRRRQ
jgi:death-on-curing protein